MKAMKKHYECAPNVWHKKTLIFDWDEETGEVTGPNRCAANRAKNYLLVKNVVYGFGIQDSFRPAVELFRRCVAKTFLHTDVVDI